MFICITYNCSYSWINHMLWNSFDAVKCMFSCICHKRYQQWVNTERSAVNDDNQWSHRLTDTEGMTYISLATELATHNCFISVEWAGNWMRNCWVLSVRCSQCLNAFSANTYRECIEYIGSHAVVTVTALVGKKSLKNHSVIGNL